MEQLLETMFPSLR